MGPTAVLVIAVVMLLFVFGAIGSLLLMYRKVPHGRALLINKVQGEPMVTFSGGVVLPVVHRAEEIDLTTKVLRIERSGRDGLHSRDHYSVDIALDFLVRVNKDPDDVIRVAASIGAERAGNPDVIRELFLAKFQEAVATVVGALDLEQLCHERDAVRDRILEIVGMDLGGFALDDVAIADLRPTSIENLDPNDLLDAQAIRTITESTARDQIRTNEMLREAQEALAQVNLSASQTLLELKRQRAELDAAIEKLSDTSVAAEDDEEHDGSPSSRTVQGVDQKKNDITRFGGNDD